MPQGVFVISAKDVSDFDAGDIPDAIYDEIFLDLVDDYMLAGLSIEDGLMFITKLDVKTLPDMMKAVLDKPFGIKDEDLAPLSTHRLAEVIWHPLRQMGRTLRRKT